MGIMVILSLLCGQHNNSSAQMRKRFIVNLSQRFFSLVLPPFNVSKATYLSLLCAQQEVRVCFVKELKQQANQ